jgi:hypothetical protein
MARKVANVHVVGDDVELPSVAMTENPAAEAEAWGSRSMSRTRCPCSPEAAERLTAVVVFSLPPVGC